MHSVLLNKVRQLINNVRSIFIHTLFPAFGSSLFSQNYSTSANRAAEVCFLHYLGCTGAWSSVRMNKNIQRNIDCTDSSSLTVSFRTCNVVWTLDAVEVFAYWPGEIESKDLAKVGYGETQFFSFILSRSLSPCSSPRLLPKRHSLTVGKISGRA